MKKLICILIAVLGVYTLSAQIIIKDAISVNGLQLGQKYTRSQIVAALGTPDKILPPQEGDTYPDTYMYIYGDNSFTTVADELYFFDMSIDKYVLNNYICVGDNIDKLAGLGGIRKQQNTNLSMSDEWRPNKEGLYYYASVRLYYNDDKKIYLISAGINDL